MVPALAEADVAVGLTSGSFDRRDTALAGPSSGVAIEVDVPPIAGFEVLSEVPDHVGTVPGWLSVLAGPEAEPVPVEPAGPEGSPAVAASELPDSPVLRVAPALADTKPNR